jgi:hypothetical protein
MFALLPFRPPLRCHIGHIVPLRTAFQVGRIAAWPVVAGVHGNVPRWQRSECSLIGNVMGVMRDTVDRERPVSPLSWRPQKRPARIGATTLIDAQEHVGRLVSLSDVVAVPAAIAIRSATRRPTKLPAARYAGMPSLYLLASGLLVKRPQSALVGAVLGSRRLVRLDVTDTAAGDTRYCNRHGITSCRIIPYPSHTDTYGSLAVSPILATPLGEE